MAKRLATQKDGRIYAVKVLQLLKDAEADDSTVGCPFNPDGTAEDSLSPPGYYRTGPQWSGFADAVFHLFKNGSEEAQKGFLSIFTDCFAGDVGMDLNFYRRLERKGWLQDYGKNGSDMPLPISKGSWAEIDRISGWNPGRRLDR